MIKACYIEDNDADVLVFQHHIKNLKIQLFLYHDIKDMDHLDFDVVFMDLHLPNGKQGFVATDYIQKILPGVPVIIVTSLGGNIAVEVEQSYRDTVNVADYIQKDHLTPSRIKEALHNANIQL